MANIKISDLRPTGSELFSDSESYMSELGDGELDSINGGLSSIIVYSAIRSSKACIKAAEVSIKISLQTLG